MNKEPEFDIIEVVGRLRCSCGYFNPEILDISSGDHIQCSECKKRWEISFEFTFKERRERE